MEDMEAAAAISQAPKPLTTKTREGLQSTVIYFDVQTTGLSTIGNAAHYIVDCVLLKCKYQCVRNKTGFFLRLKVWVS